MVWIELTIVWIAAWGATFLFGVTLAKPAPVLGLAISLPGSLVAGCLAIVMAGPWVYDCPHSTECLVHGLCSYGELSCVASSDVDCAGSQYCAHFGKCNARGGRCDAIPRPVVPPPPTTAAVPPDSCVDTPECTERGRCTSRGISCVAAADTDCRRSFACVKLGECSAKKGKCVVARDADCTATPACRLQGQCHAKDGACER